MNSPTEYTVLVASPQHLSGHIPPTVTSAIQACATQVPTGKAQVLPGLGPTLVTVGHDLGRTCVMVRVEVEAQVEVLKYSIVIVSVRIAVVSAGHDSIGGKVELDGIDTGPGEPSIAGLCPVKTPL